MHQKKKANRFPFLKRATILILLLFTLLYFFLSWDSYKSPFVLTSEESKWFNLKVTNPLIHLPPRFRFISTLPFSPGIPSLAAYEFAISSPTFKAMEQFSDSFLKENKALVARYKWSPDPLHAWSRKYEYVWHAEALRAGLPSKHAAAVAKTWPGSFDSLDVPPYTVLDAGSGFTFFDQFIGSRLGVSVTALDYDRNFTSLFSGLSRVLPNEPFVPPIPYILAAIEETKLPDASIDAITCVSVLEHMSSASLTATVVEFKRILKPGGRLVLTFDTGQPPVAKNAEQSASLLNALRGQFNEDVMHNPPAVLKNGLGKAAVMFTNHKASPPEYADIMLISISAHIFVKG
jgi:SAM-dependent methyltransferase